MLAHKGQHLLGARLHLSVPCVPGAWRPARMQQGQGLARQETVVDEEGLFDRQARIAALQLADAIVFNAVREDQILGASGRANRVGLDKAQARNGPQQAGGLEKAARDHVAAKLLETGDFERAHAWRPVGEGSLPLIHTSHSIHRSLIRIQRNQTLNMNSSCIEGPCLSAP